MEKYALRRVKITLTADSLMQSDLIFFEIRSESLNKSAMSCCSFLVEVAYTVSQETIHGFQQIRCRGANNHH